MHQLKVACRQILVRPVLSGLIVVMLAIGIGATTAIYSLFSQVLIEPLPVYEPERLVNLSSPGFKFGSTWGGGSVSDSDSLFTHEMFEDLAANQNVFSGVAAHTDFEVSFGFEERASTGLGALVSGSYFGVLGLAPALGRLLQPQDSDVIDGAPVVVLSFDFWQREFEGREDVVGETLIVNGQTLEIVGVAPRGFAGTAIGWHADVFVPYTMRWLVQPAVPRGTTPRRAYWLYLFARLAPGVERLEAEVEVTALYQGLLRDVVVPGIQEISADRREEFLAREILLGPGDRSTCCSDLPSSCCSSSASTWPVCCLRVALRGPASLRSGPRSARRAVVCFGSCCSSRRCWP
jgi:putative ABC transport system permease protein